MSDKYLNRPQDQRFWQIIAACLQPLGIGFQQWWGYPKQHKIFTVMFYITSIFGPITLLSQILYFYMYYDQYSFIYLGNIFTVIMITFIIVMKLLCTRKKEYEDILKKFMSKIHIYYYEPRNEYVNKMTIRMELVSRTIIILNGTAMALDFFFWMSIPIVNNYLNGAFKDNSTVRLQTVVYMIMPFDYEYNIKNWIIMYVVSLYTAAFGCALFIISDAILFTIILHLLARISILKNNLKNITDLFDELTENDISKRLGICVRDHCLLIQTFNELQGSFGLSVTGYYAFNLIFDALLIIELNYGDTSTKVSYLLMVIIYVGGLIAMSVIMEEIRIQSDDLPQAVYDVPWERMSLSHQRIILIILARVQPVLVFKAFAGLEAGIKPTINIAKSTFSYYVMLKSKSVG